MGREPDGRHNERNSLVTWFDSKTTHFKNKEKAVANYNKVMLIGRLTRDVETRTFSNGGMVCKFGFATEGSRRKDQATGKWESEPCFLDVEAFNRGENGKLASNCEQFLKKGSQVFIEGKLVMQSWTGQDGSKRNKIVVEAFTVEFLDSRGGEQQQSRSESSEQRSATPQPVDLFGGSDNPFA